MQFDKNNNIQYIFDTSNKIFRTFGGQIRIFPYIGHWSTWTDDQQGLETYCHKTPYMFAFVLLIISWVTIPFIFVACCCGVCIALCASKWRTIKEHDWKWRAIKNPVYYWSNFSLEDEYFKNELFSWRDLF